MIKQSTTIAMVAIVLSLLLHFVGLDFVTSTQPERSSHDVNRDAVVTDYTFKDVAESVIQPVTPEPPSPPEPPLEETPKPETSEIPTSEALVASDNPQRVFAPDSGIVTSVQPDMAEPSKPEQGGAAEPETVETVETVEPVHNQDESDVDLAVRQPIETDTVGQTPEENSDTNTEPAEADVGDSAPDPQESATAPVRVTPLELDPITPDTAEPVVEPTPESTETVETEGEIEGSDLAVLSSLRPRLPTRRPAEEPIEDFSESTEPNDSALAPTQLVESPLVAYQRTGINPFLRKESGTGSNGSGSSDSLGPGNSDVTNYVGRVLMHLNRATAVRVSGRGFARVLFEINPDGTLAWVEVIDSSGSQEIERAAKTQVRNAAPFPRPPNGVSRKLNFAYRSN